MRIFDSNKECFVNEFLVVQFDHIQMPHGTGRLCRDFGETNTEFINKRVTLNM